MDRSELARAIQNTGRQIEQIEQQLKNKREALEALAELDAKQRASARQFNEFLERRRRMIQAASGRWYSAGLAAGFLRVMGEALNGRDFVQAQDQIMQIERTVEQKKREILEEMDRLNRQLAQLEVLEQEQRQAYRDSQEENQ